MQSSNPALQNGIINKISRNLEDTDSMTTTGSISKLVLLLVILLSVGAWSWGFTSNNPASALSLAIGASIAGFITAMVIIFFKQNPLMICIYAGLQGLLMGSISYVFNDAAQNIVQQAVVLTISITLGMLLLYSTGLVKVTDKLRSVILISTFGVAIFYVFSYILGIFFDSIYEFSFAGSSGFIIALIIVIIASLNLLLDFDFIDKGSQNKLPKQFEWYGAFGILITLIWLYISILRMLFISRD